MTVQELIDGGKFETVHAGEDTAREITGLFCCDLLSIAMGRAPAGSAWVTVMGNINTLAVATLADVACIIMAEGVELDELVRAKAAAQGLTVLRTELPIFDAALWIHQQLHG
ncbi:MAG: hypothetical protein PHV18_12245 [Lachnospiraceae bacterium]|nr:hypothetical protein [Lachnospiraceae bacterium]